MKSTGSEAFQVRSSAVYHRILPNHKPLALDMYWLLMISLIICVCITVMTAYRGNSTSVKLPMVDQIDRALVNVIVDIKTMMKSIR